MGNLELWMRGEAAGGPVAMPGEWIHDFGDGMYFTDQHKVARMYAEKNAASPDQQRIVGVVIDTSKYRVLDLRDTTKLEGQKWAEQFSPKTPGGEKLFEVISSGTLNKMYGTVFDTFLRANNLNRNDYDLIIGPEYVRGGMQMCVVQKGAGPSALALQLRSEFKTISVGPAGPPQTAKAVYRPPQIRSVTPRPVSLGDRFTMPNNPLRRVAANQNAMAALGIAFEAAGFWYQQKEMAAEVRRRLETKYRDYVQQAFSRGEGVLAIIYINEWILPDVNGFYPKMLAGVAVESGPTQDDAFYTYRSRQNLTPGPSPNCRIYEMYQWVSASGSD